MWIVAPAIGCPVFSSTTRPVIRYFATGCASAGPSLGPDAEAFHAHAPAARARKAVDAIQTIVVDKKPKETITSGPYLFMDAVLVDKNNVQQFLKK